jgi:hypothetical protein
MLPRLLVRDKASTGEFPHNIAGASERFSQVICRLYCFLHCIQAFTLFGGHGVFAAS